MSWDFHESKFSYSVVTAKVTLQKNIQISLNINNNTLHEKKTVFLNDGITRYDDRLKF